MRLVILLLSTVSLSACALEATIPDQPQQIGRSNRATVTYESGAANPDEALGDVLASASAPDERRANFAANTEAALAAPPMRGGGFTSFEQASQCTVLLTAAEAAVAPCAEELFVDNCGDGKGHYKGSECPRCEVLRTKDEDLSDKGCPPRVRYPPYRL